MAGIKVKPLAPLAAMLIALLWAPLSTADSGALNSLSEANTTVLESAYGSPTSEGSSLVGLIPAHEELSEMLQNLSSLPVMALGILGLFWVRRHTAEL